MKFRKFTLIELTFVIGIIALLMSYNFTKLTAIRNTMMVKSDMTTIKNTVRKTQCKARETNSEYKIIFSENGYLIHKIGDSVDSKFIKFESDIRFLSSDSDTNEVYFLKDGTPYSKVVLKFYNEKNKRYFNVSISTVTANVKINY